MVLKISISLFQFYETFYIFSDPNKCTIEQRKRATKVMIALSAESDRMMTLSKKFGATLCDESKQLSGPTDLLIKNWKKVSHKIINNSKPSTLNNNMNNILNESDAEFIKILSEARMKKVKNTPNVY